MDSGTGDHRTDLADPLPDHPRDVRVRLRADVSRQGRLEDRPAVCHQPRGELDLHPDPIWDAEPTPCCCGHSDCLEHDHLVGLGDLATLSLGGSGSDPIFRLGVTGHRAATEHYLEQLVKTATK